jgi:hypothetical protein
MEIECEFNLQINHFQQTIRFVDGGEIVPTSVARSSSLFEFL